MAVGLPIVKPKRSRCMGAAGGQCKFGRFHDQLSRPEQEITLDTVFLHFVEMSFGGLSVVIPGAPVHQRAKIVLFGDVGEANAAVRLMSEL